MFTCPETEYERWGQPKVQGRDPGILCASVKAGGGGGGG